MPDQKTQEPIPELPKARVRTYSENDELFPRTPIQGKPILPGSMESTQYTSGYTPYTDPFFTGGDRDFEERMKQVEGGLDAVQPWYDKLGNGVVKFAGAFADGILSTVGTIYGIPASLITWDKTQMWDNPFTNLGNDISTSVSENFQNYRSTEEQNANAWSPDYWMTMNFFSDNILGNLGYAAAAIATGAGVSKVLSKIAPYIAGKNLAAGLDIIESGGAEALKDMTKAYNAVRRWDKTQQAISVGISASGEGSVEALSTYKETKQKLTDIEAAKYGGKEYIPEGVLSKIEADAKSAGNITYGLNLPILAGANMIMWGKSLSGFNSEFKQMAKNSARLTALEEFGTYAAAQDQVKSGMSRALVRSLTATGKALKSNFAEAGQEGLQFIASEGTKNWYARDHDQRGWDAVSEYNDPYVDALVKLVTTQEGVANLIGGFAGGMPFGLKDYVRAISGDPKAKALMDKQLDAINNPFVEGTIKDNLKIYMRNMARHASAEADFQEALASGNEREARTAKFDQLKSYIDSRIQTGRMDLLEDEINQLKSLSNEDFKSFFGFDQEENIDKNVILDKFKNTATDMHETYKMMDRLFIPDNYRLNKLAPEDRDAKLKDLHEYKSMLWSYMMDYKDRDKRAKQLDTEVGAAFGGILSTEELFKDEFKSDQLNDIYRQYVAANIEYEVSKQANPQYKDSSKEAEITALKSRLKARMEELSKGDIAKFATMQEFQGTGRKDFIEDYIYNVNKRIIPIINNPVAQTALNLADISHVISKTNDLVDLHADRRMAINAYNQLASVIKTGEFMGMYVNNPEYNEEVHKDVPEFIQEMNDEGEMENVPNPEFVPKKIRSNKMLEYDGYKNREDERKNFRKEQQEKRDKDQQAQDDFNQELDDIVDINLTEKSKDFHNRVKEIINGSENSSAKPLKSLTIQQLNIAKAIASRNMQVAEGRGDFAITSAKERTNFDRKRFIDVYAHVKAVNDEITRRANEYRDYVNTRANDLVTYVRANQIDPSNLIEGFKIGNAVIPNDIVSRAAAIITKENADAAEAIRLKEQADNAAQRAGKVTQTNEAEPIITDEIYDHFKKNGKLDAEYIGYVQADLAAKLAKGEVLTDREAEVYQVHKDRIDKKVKAKYGTNPIVKTKVVQAGNRVIQEPVIISDEVTNESISEGVTRTANEAKSISPYRLTGAFLRLQRSDLTTTKVDGKFENQYNDDGTVQLNQFSFSLFDPTSPVNLHTKPEMRFRFVGFSKHGNIEEPTLLLQVRAASTDNWQDTNYYMQGLYNMEGKLIEPILSKNEEENKKLVADFQALIKQMQDEAKANDFVDVEIKGGIGFGSLIENQKDADGNRKRLGLIAAFGNDINSRQSLSSVKMGVILNDSKTDSVIVFHDENSPAGTLSDVNDIPGVYVHKSLVNAVANADGKGTGDRGGQYVALLPTGQMTADGSSQFHYPVLLAGKALADISTKAYDIGSGRNKGTDANIGEILVDALLNPHDAKYKELFSQMFEMVGLEYKGPDESNWKAFYTDANIHNIINKVMFSAGKTLDNATEYKRPFKFEVVDTSEKGGAIMIRIGIAPDLAKDRRTVDIFLSTKDNKLVKPQTDAEKADFVQARITQTYEFRKSQGKTDTVQISYADIQDVIKDKVFHVQIKEMSRTTPTAYSGFVLEDNKLKVKQFPSYFHYVDELGLAQTTIQGIEDPQTKRRQYFVNQQVYLAPKAKVAAVPSKEIGNKVVKKKPVEPKAKKTISKEKADVIIGKEVNPLVEAKEAVTGSPKKVSIKAKSSTEAQKNVQADQMAGIRKATNIMGGRGRGGKKAMISLDTYKSIQQRAITSMGSADMHRQELITDELTAILLNKLIDFKAKKRGKYGVEQLKTSLRTTMLENIFTLMQEARPSIAELNFKDWLKMDLEHPDSQWLTEVERDLLSATAGNQYDSLTHAYTLFDVNEFNTMFKNGEMTDEQFNLLFDGGTKEEPLFFIGYANRALARLAELQVIKAVNTGSTEIELDEESGNYTQRFNDSWALMVNPKDTLGLQAKVFLNTIPEIQFIRDEDGNITGVDKQQSITGFNRNMRYDSVFVNLINMGLEVQPENFENELINNPFYEINPVIRAIRLRLDEIKSEKGTAIYKQIIQQIATTVTSLRINGVHQAFLTKNPGDNVRVKIISAAKANTSGQIIEKWQSQFTHTMSELDAIIYDQQWDDKLKLYVTKPRLNTEFEINVKTKKGIEKKEGDFAEFFINEVKNTNLDYVIGKNSGKLSLDGYVRLANLVKDTLGIELIEGDFKDAKRRGIATGMVLRDIANVFDNTPGKENNALRFRLKQANIKSFSEFWDRTFNTNIVNKIKQAVKEGTYNDNEPFRNSMTAMDLLSRMFQEWHQSITNPQAKDIQGKNQYVYVPSDMIHQEFKRFKSEEVMKQLQGLPIMEFDYHLSKQFTDGNYTPTAAWRQIYVDTMNGMRLTSEKRRKRKGKNKGDIIEARKVPAGDVSIMSMTFYENEENTTSDSEQPERGMAKYFVPFGDSSAATFFNFNKYAFDFEYNDGKLVIKNGPVREMIYGHFKSEINRSLRAFQAFDEVNNNPDLSLAQKKAKLDKGYHYFERGDIIIPGAATRMYYFGDKMGRLSENHPVFDTMVVNGEIRNIGLNDGIVTPEGNLNDETIRGIFDGFIDGFMSEVVNSKLKELEPIKDSFFELNQPELIGDKYASPKFSNNIMDLRYVKSIRNIFMKSSIIDGKPIHEYFNEKITLFNTPEEANENGYHAQVLKTAVIDQQVNAFIANTLLRKMTWDFAAFDETGNWDKFNQVLGKRESGFNSPFINTASNSNVQTIIFNDVSYGSKKVAYVDIAANLKPQEIALFDFMKKNGLEAYVTDKVPARYEELAAVYYAGVMDKQTNKQIAKTLKAALNSKITDGGSIITLREYLYQMHQSGTISQEEFAKLYSKFNNPDLILTEEDTKELVFKGQKMVTIGSVYASNRKAPVYIKDSKLVLIPAQAKGTRFESILDEISQREDKSLNPSPGIQLVPLSGAKLHNGKVIDLFDQDDNIVEGAISNATIFSYPRNISGEQVQNPGKKNNAITKGIQLEKYMFDNVHDDKIFAEDQFSSPKAETPIEIKTESAKSYGVRTGKSIPAKGITKLELRNTMINLIRSMHEYKLQDMIDRFGLDYNISDEWKQAAQEQGYTDYEEFQAAIDALENSKDYDERQQARDMNYRKYSLVARTINKMINDIKQQAYSKKGIEISQLRPLNEIVVDGDGKDQTEALRMSLTFTPGNKQYQQIILSEIESLFAHTKLNGFGAIQTSSTFHENVEGSSALKGYGLVYDAEGNVVNFDHAEIGIPWIFKDESGKPLDYNKYVNEDGTPKVEKFDPEVLNIIGYRIPNTGLNMAGSFKVARFFKPGYTDAIMIPDILYSQMGTDLDFDKLYNYLYNYRLDDKGKITKVQGVISMRQAGAKEIINSDESKRWALHNSLMTDNPGYRIKYKLFKQAVSKLNARLDELQPTTEQEDDQPATGGLFAGMDMNEMIALQKRIEQEQAENKEQDPAASNEAVEALKKQFEGLINDFTELQGIINKRKENFNHEGWIGRRSDNYLKAQSYKQLENALFDIYHIVMSDMEMLPSMLTPLTSDMVTEHVDDQKYDGRSIAQMEASSIVNAPNTEAYQMRVRGDNKSSNENIGALANAQSVIDAYQTANLSVGSKREGGAMRPVVFRGEDGKIIEENEADPLRFVTPEVNTEKSIGYPFQKMELNLPSLKRAYAIPHRLARIYGVNGKTKVTSVVQSLLQSFLDFNNNKNVAHTNVNLATLNPLIAMVGLGYTDHVLDFAAQEILKDYAKGFYNQKSPFIKTEDFLYDIVKNTVNKAGLSEEMFNTYMTANAEDVEAALAQMLIEQKLGDKKHDYNRFFNQKDLHDMITQQYSDNKTSKYYINQLHVLDMFLRLKPIGEQTFYLMQSINLESKGFTNMSILGAMEQINNHNNVGKFINPISGDISFEGLIGSEKLGPWNKEDNPNGMQTVHTAALAYAKKGMDILKKNNGIFADLTSSFRAYRRMLSTMTGKRNLPNQERFNINIIQWRLSDIALYKDFLDVIPEQDRNTAHDVRKHVFMDDMEITMTVKNGIGRERTNILEPSLARRIMDIKQQVDPESGLTYEQIYPALDYFNTNVKNNMDSPSWVTKNNTSTFKERVGQETPFNIQQMLNDSNPEVAKIAKYLYLAYYLGSGVTTPKSIGHLLPQENLFIDGGFADTLAEQQEYLDREVEGLEREVKSVRTFTDYNKPYWFKIFDPQVVKVNRAASERMLELYTHYLQMNPFEAEMQGYVKGQEFEETNDPNVVRLLPKGKIEFGDQKQNPKSFMETTGDPNSDEGATYTLYVINSDYNTYTRVNRAGTTNYTEFNYGNRIAPTLIRKNQIRDTQEESNTTEDESTGDTILGVNKVLADVNTLVPVKMDVENDLNAVYQLTFLNDGSRKLEDFAENPVEEKELTALATTLFPVIPANTKLMPYSIQKANKEFLSSRGYISVNGKEAFGSYLSGNPNGLVQIAYQALDQDKKDPLILKKTLLHESAHAATYNVFKILERLESGQLKKAEAAEALQLSKDSEQGRIGDIQDMLKAYKRLKELFVYLKNNPKLKEKYLEANGHVATDKAGKNDISRLNVIMSDLDEFTARLFNDKAFRDALKAVPYESKTMFERILDFLREILGLQKGTAAYHAFGNLFEILEPVKGSKIPAEGYRPEDIDKMFSANTEVDKKALLELRDMYKDVSNFDSQYASPEELKLYDRLVKEGKIIC